jgi:hypothetical protein
VVNPTKDSKLREVTERQGVDEERFLRAGEVGEEVVATGLLILLEIAPSC